MNQRFDPYIGRRIRDARKSQKITQMKLAARLQSLRAPISRAIIANWETGRGNVPAYCIQIVAYSLGTKVADLLPDLTVKEITVGPLESRHAHPQVGERGRVFSTKRARRC